MAPGSDNESDNEAGQLFKDPEDYYPPSPPPTSQTHTLGSGETLTLHLVGHSPLEAHRLWNGSRVIADFLAADPAIVKDKAALELGAGAGLPSLVCGILGAQRVVMTDFPDADLVANMQKNIDAADSTMNAHGRLQEAITATGFVWGGDPRPLLARLPPGREKFDVLILADLLFRHSEHGKLVKTITETLRRDGDGTSAAYVFFTSYRPWLQHKDLAFFDVAREHGLVVEKVLERKMERPLFEGDPGDVEVQKTVTGFTVRWPMEEKHSEAV
jgi:EEF1A N-terminal glycine/lysine methyltransferase